MATEAAHPAPAGEARTSAGSRRARQGQTRVLAVDDDPQTLSFVRDALANAGYTVTVTGDPEQVGRLVEEERPHLALLDLMLPGMDGIELMESVPGLAGVPVIFLFAYGRDQVIARALEAGAEDYVVKPFSPTELVARVQTVLRRRAASELSEPSEPYRRGELIIDYTERRVSLAGSAVRLTTIEYRMLFELSVNAGRVLTHEQLLQRVWGPEHPGRPGAVRTFIKNLRRKLGDDADTPTYIFTDPRVGYRMPRGRRRERRSRRPRRFRDPCVALPRRTTIAPVGGFVSPSAQPHLEDGSVYRQNRPAGLSSGSPAALLGDAPLYVSGSGRMILGCLILNIRV